MISFKSVRFFLTLSFICAGTVLFSLHPGTLSVQWFGHNATMPVVVFLAILFALFSGIVLLYSAYCWIKNIPSQSRNYFKKRREKYTEDLLLEGFSAIAGQQHKDAQLIATKLTELSPNHPLALFLLAQSSYLNKDFGTAQDAFIQMVQKPATQFLGLRGQVLLALEKNDPTEASRLLQKMYALQPTAPWVLQQLSTISLQEALTTDTTAPCLPLSFYRNMPPQEAAIHKGLLDWIQFKKEEMRSSERSEAREIKLRLLKSAHTHLPENPVITQTYATFLAKEGFQRKAFRVLNTGFKNAPHRCIGETILHLKACSNPLEAYKLIEKLTSQHPNHEESYWLNANAACEAKLWGQARHQLAPLLLAKPTRSLFELMLKIEQAEFPSDSTKHALWKEKLAQTTLEWQWVCTHCSLPTATFEPACMACGTFGQIQWKKIAPVPGRARLTEADKTANLLPVQALLNP